MSILLICDLCGSKIGSEDEKNIEHSLNEPIKSYLVDESIIRDDSPDLCDNCLTTILTGIAATALSIRTQDVEEDKKRVMPKGITRETKSRATHKYAKAMRLRLCELVDGGRYNRDYIANQLYKEFPHYKSVISVNARISDLLNKDHCYSITKNTKFEGRQAVKSKYNNIIKWRDEDA